VSFEHFICEEWDLYQWYNGTIKMGRASRPILKCIRHDEYKRSYI